jgi:hypothetical protein
MDKYKKLNIARSIFAFIIFVAFGIIICTEKGGDLLIPKVKEKLNEYITTNYHSIINDINQEEITYKDKTFTMKIYDKTNINHYFYITYNNGKITDTYKEDYIQGKSLLNEIQKNLEKEIYNKTKIESKVNILSTLDKYTSRVQESILKGNNLERLKFYTLSINIDLKTWDETNASKVITDTLNTYIKHNINPKSYTITINNLNEITESIEIYNIDNDFINNEYKEQILSDIINNKKSDLLDEYKITFKHLN